MAPKKRRWNPGHTREEEGDEDKDPGSWRPKIVWFTDTPKNKNSNEKLTDEEVKSILRAYEDVIDAAAHEFRDHYKGKKCLRAWYIRSQIHNTTTERGASEDDDHHITIFANQDPDKFKKGRPDNEFDYSGHIYVRSRHESQIDPGRMLHPDEFKHKRFPVKDSDPEKFAPLVFWDIAEQGENPAEYDPEVFGPGKRYYEIMDGKGNGNQEEEAEASTTKSKKELRKQKKAADAEKKAKKKAAQAKETLPYEGKGKGKAKAEDQGDEDGGDGEDDEDEDEDEDV